MSSLANSDHAAVIVLAEIETAKFRATSDAASGDSSSAGAEEPPASAETSEILTDDELEAQLNAYMTRSDARAAAIMNY